MEKNKTQEYIDNVNVQVIKWDVDWKEIKNACRTTIGQGDSSVEPNDNWKKKLLMAEHSPIRHSLITVELDGIPYSIMGHLVRHSVGVTPYVSTSREDRTGIPREERSQMDTVNMKMDMNIQSLINISRKRLCNQADPITKGVWEKVVGAVAQVDPIVAQACVPECIRDGGCPEFSPCGYYEAMDAICDLSVNTNLQDRYDRYNKLSPKRKRLLKKDTQVSKN